MAYKPYDFPQFTPPDSSMVRAWANKLKDYFLHNVITALNIQNRSELKFNRDVLYEIFTRIEKRRVYFHIYHSGMEMGEINEGALLCFWILKLMPCQMKGISASLLNTKIAYIIFVNLLHYVANESNKKAGAGTKLHVNIKKRLMDDLLYAFQYRDLSKEAIMALAESYLF
jgi:hypothetical protein